MDTDGEARLVRDLVAASPGFEDLLACHLFNEGGLLAHVFFGDVVRETVASFLGHGETDWRATLRFLEETLRRGDPGATDVVVTSFLDALPWPGRPGHALTTRLGPQLAARFALLRPHG